MIQGQHDSGAQKIKIENSTDVDEFTKIVDMTYTIVNNAGTILPFDDFTVNTKSSCMFVLSQDRNSGYTIVNPVAIDYPTPHSRAVQEVFDSFELVT